jgi:hypothetical protein
MKIKNTVAVAPALALALTAACFSEETPPSPEGTIELTIEDANDDAGEFLWMSVRDLQPIAPADVVIFAGYVDADGVAQLKAGPAAEVIDDRSLRAVVELGVPADEFVVDGVAVSFIVVVDAATPLPSDGDLAELDGDLRLDVRQPRYIVEPRDDVEEAGLERYGWELVDLAPLADQVLTGRFHIVE